LIKARNKQIRFSSVDFNGILIVTEKNKFYRALFKGIGREKAFGCGLLMIKRSL
jgi:CRISPR system Cascade subunit CasE